MNVTLTLPDNFRSLSPVAQLDTVMNALTMVLLKVASDNPSTNAPTAAAALAVAAPFGVDNYGRPFKTQAEADDWKARSDARERNLDGSDAANQATLRPGAVDILTLDDADLRFLGAFYNELVPTGLVGPVAIAQKLSHFMDYGASETNKHVVELPNMGEWDAAEAREIKNGKWDSNYRGRLREVLAKHRGRDDI